MIEKKKLVETFREKSSIFATIQSLLKKGVDMHKRKYCFTFHDVTYKNLHPHHKIKIVRM